MTTPNLTSTYIITNGQIIDKTGYSTSTLADHFQLSPETVRSLLVDLGFQPVATAGSAHTKLWSAPAMKALRFIATLVSFMKR